VSDSNFSVLLRSCMDAAAVAGIESSLHLPADVLAEQGQTVSRRTFAMALNAVLFHDLLKRVPSGADYVTDVRRGGGRVVFDHGAVRTIEIAGGHVGALPSGEAALTRILLSLGYGMRGVYPLPKLRMTGRSYAHDDGAADIPQFFVSELHVNLFPVEFQSAARRVFGTSRDPLGTFGRAALQSFSIYKTAGLELACASLPEIAACFGCQHDIPALADYEILRAHSKEAAWMATEGNAFNHATDRVANVEAVADEQRQRGRRVKDRIEVAREGRVRQTAFRADPVERKLRGADGSIAAHQVPGSFFEFITRESMVAGGAGLDLGFDSGNAQGIFKMTEAAAS
jgi:hypothetical protein